MTYFLFDRLTTKVSMGFGNNAETAARYCNVDWRSAGGEVAPPFVSLASTVTYQRAEGSPYSKFKTQKQPGCPTQHTRATMHIFLFAIITLVVAPAAPSFSAPQCDGQCNHQCSEVSITAYTCQENCMCSSKTTRSLICAGTGTCDSEETKAVCEAKMIEKTLE